jgi:hypothetical protein
MVHSYLTSIQTTDDLEVKLRKSAETIEYVCGIVLTRPNDARNVLLDLVKEIKDGFVCN